MLPYGPCSIALGKPPREFEMAPGDALELLNEAINQARSAGLPWEGEIELTPSPDLVELVSLSQKLAATSSEEEG